VIISEVVNLGLTEAIDRIKELHKKYNLAASNLILANKKETYVVEYLHEKISAQKVKDFVARTNFSPKFGYWDLEWDPKKTPSKFHTTVRNVNRYLRAFHLFSTLENKPTFEKIRAIMSDHRFYPGVLNRADELYELIRNGKTQEAISSLRKIEEKPSNYTICTHPSEVGKEFIKRSTVFNFTTNLITREIEIVFGNPCFRETVLKLTI
jgi:hypothetical protein